MSERLLLVLLLGGMVAAFGLGVWIGLGYPGLYDRYEASGHRAPRRTPFQLFMDWIVRKFGG